MGQVGPILRDRWKVSTQLALNTEGLPETPFRHTALALSLVKFPQTVMAARKFGPILSHCGVVRCQLGQKIDRLPIVFRRRHHLARQRQSLCETSVADRQLV